MAEAVGFAIIEAIALSGEAEALVAFGEATVLGISGASVIGGAVLIGAAIGLQYALRQNPDLPKPENGSVALKQAVPPRIRGYGFNRLAGYYMMYEEANTNSYDVLAFHSGKIQGILGYFLHDDPVRTTGTIGGGDWGTVIADYSDERYSGNHISIETRLGDEVQFAGVFSSDPLVGGIWDASHTGNGIAWAALACAGVAIDDFTKIYPHGHPELSLVVNCSRVWDPRMGYSRAEEWAWASTTNPVIQLIDYLTRADGGVGLDYDTLFPPNVLAAWMVEADLCDQRVARADGSTEQRYVSSGWFQFDNDPEAVINSILSTCDGWLAEAGDGTLAITVGVYRTPTDPPLTEKHIKGFSCSYGQADEAAINQLDISFTDPNQKYVTVQIDPWRDEDAISRDGALRSQSLDLKWVQSPSQCYRLADRAMQRLNPAMSGTFVTSLAGLRYLGKRWVPLQYPFVSGLQDCVVEIQGADVDLLAGRISFTFFRINTGDIEAYDPVSDEGDIPAPSPAPPGAGLAMRREDDTALVRETTGFVERET